MEFPVSHLSVQCFNRHGVSLLIFDRMAPFKWRRPIFLGEFLPFQPLSQTNEEIQSSLPRRPPTSFKRLAQTFSFGVTRGLPWMNRGELSWLSSQPPSRLVTYAHFTALFLEDSSGSILYQVKNMATGNTKTKFEMSIEENGGENFPPRSRGRRLGGFGGLGDLPPAPPFEDDHEVFPELNEEDFSEEDE